MTMDKKQITQAVNTIQKENFDLKINLLSLINDYNQLKKLVVTNNCHKRCFLELEQLNSNENKGIKLDIDTKVGYDNKLGFEKLSDTNKMFDYIHDFDSEDEYMLSRTTSPGSDSLMETLTRLNTELSVDGKSGNLMRLPVYNDKSYELKFENFLEDVIEGEGFMDSR